MSYNWAEAGPIKINVVSWPPSTSVGGGRERAEWILETLGDVSASELFDGIEALRPALRSELLEARFDVVGDGLLRCVFDYDSALPVSERVSAAALLWRYIDEGLARLWQIGGIMRANIPEFMCQRRQMVQRLPADQRMLWMAASLMRIEPFWAARADQQSVAEELLELLAARSSPRRFIEATELRMRELRTNTDAGSASHPAMASIDSLDQAVARLFRRSSEAFETEEINAIAASTEEVIEVLLRIAVGRQATSSELLARREDEIWWLDAKDLLANSDRARINVTARSVEQVSVLTTLLCTP